MEKSNSNENRPNKPFDLELATRQENIRLGEAMYAEDINLARTLLNGGLADVNYCDKEGISMLYVAIAAGNVAMVKLLLNFQPVLTSRGVLRCSPIWMAALMGENEIVSLLVQAGADVNERLNVKIPGDDMCPHTEGMTLLHLAVMQKKIPEITLLLGHGADINALDADCISPLHAALQLENAEIAKLLLEKGASVDSANSRGETILQRALLFGNLEIISIILSRKPDVHVTDETGKNALHYLAQASVRNLAIAERLIKEGVSINQPETDCGVTPLHIALMSNTPSLINLFVQHGADVNLSITCGYSSINLAAVCCNSFIIRLLLKKGANPNSITDTGETALHRVCRQNSVEKINTLLKYGADVNVKSKSGKTAIECLKYFHTAAAKSLIKHIAKLESFNLFVDESILRFIENNEPLTEYHDSCLEELQSMKNLTFYNNFSFYYVFKHNTERLSKLTANEDFTENFKSFNVVSRFPWYGKEVENNFKRAVRRMISYQRLTKHLSLVFYHRYDSVLEHIVNYLKPSDIPLTLA